MEKYEQLSVVGEGSYGLVMKCRHRETDQIVAVKKFLETEEDATVRRMALREIRMLKRLKHENLVTMIEVFRYRKRFYIVFEFLDGTVLDELEKMPNGLGEERCRERIFQVVRAIHYCHANQIIHRDVKPENVLVSSMGVVKLCDFGFARLVNIAGEPCTEYVATRWYRAPELLVGEASYGPPVDIWALGCLFAEMMTGDPIFPGESDIDQLFLIVKMLGKPCSKHQALMSKNVQFRGMTKTPHPDGLHKTYPTWPIQSLDFLSRCLAMDPLHRSSAEDLLNHSYFCHDKFPQKFLPALRDKVTIEFNSNPLLRRFKTEVLMSTDKVSEVRRKSFTNEQFRWKFELTEGCMKRKLSGEGGAIDDKNLITLDGSSQRLNVVQNWSQNKSNLPVKQKTSKQQIDSPPKVTKDQRMTAEMQMLEKSLQSLAKTQQNSTNKQDADLVTADKGDTQHISNVVSQTHPKCQLLHSNCGLGDCGRSMNSVTTVLTNHQTVLHPSINNISFIKEPPKKSPNAFQALSNPVSKFQISHGSLFSHRCQFIKKNERNNVMDMISGDHAGHNNAPPPWLAGLTNNAHRRKETKPREEFTLPSLPGATGSPNKAKKKSLPEIESLQSTQVTPRIQSSTSQKSLQKSSPTKQNFL